MVAYLVAKVSADPYSSNLRHWELAASLSRNDELELERRYVLISLHYLSPLLRRDVGGVVLAKNYTRRCVV